LARTLGELSAGSADVVSALAGEPLVSVEGGADVVEHALTRTDAPISKAMDLPRCMSEEYET
jgi:hypothetical protein